MPDGAYKRDALAWAAHQAGLLRRLAAGERLNEAVDWTHVIEVEDVGLSELRTCRPPLPLPDSCPYALDDLLSGEGIPTCS